MREQRILVWGLHCQRCTGSVERRVKSLPGVHAMLVHAPKQQVIVVNEEARCDRTRIEWVIYDEGYDVIPTPRASGRLNFQRFETAGGTEDFPGDRQLL